MSHALKIAVERAVRPIQAPQETRLRMRQELLAHLEAIHAEEAARGGTEADVLQRTLTRFGPSEELTAELRHSLNWPERYEAWLNSWVARRPSESPLRAAARMAVMAFVLMNALLLLVVVEQTLAANRDAPSVALTVSLATMLAADTFALTWLAVACGDYARCTPTPAWRSPQVWLAGAVGGLVIAASGLILTAAAARGWDLPPRAGGLWGLLAVCTVVGFVGVLELYRREHAREAEWTTLDLTLAE